MLGHFMGMPAHFTLELKWPDTHATDGGTEQLFVSVHLMV